MVSTRDVSTIQPHQSSTPSKVGLIIRNQSPGFELVSPLCCSGGAECYLSPDQRIDVGFTTQVGFSIDPDQEPIGVLMYKLQRKNIDEEAISGEGEATCIWLVVVWKVYISRKFCVILDLIEHDKGHVWDNDELMELDEYYKPYDIQHGHVEETYLMHDNTVLTAGLNIVCKGEYYELGMTISEGSIKEDTQRLHYIGLDE
jgi:hypothetical protein